MINLRELRIGNLVKCLVHMPVGYYKSAVAYSEITGLKSNGVETDAGNFKFKEIDEITLTESVLLKAGAIQKKDKFIFGDGNTDKLTVTIIRKSGKFYLAGNDDEIYSVAINSVHQLQNIYFDLRREELDIEL